MLRLAVARVAQSPGDAGGAAPAWLGASERRRWTTLPPAARQAFVGSRMLLRELLQVATGVAAAAWDVSAEVGNAPVATSPAMTGAVHVSLSHRLGWVAASVAAAPVGVDLEVSTPPRSDPAERAALMLSPDEFADWRGLPAAEGEPALLRAWVAKEAWFKAMPAGAAPWDFRGLAARACAAAHANVRVWQAGQVFVGLCCADAQALARFVCEGLPGDEVLESTWRVGPAA